MNVNLNLRLILSFLLVTLVSVALALAVAVYQSQESLRQRTSDEIRSAARFAAVRIDQFLEERLSQMRLLADADALEGSDPAAMSRFLTETVQSAPAMHRLAVSRADGRIVAASEPGLVGRSLGSLDAESGGLAGKALQGRQDDVFVRGAYLDPQTREIQVRLLAPVVEDRERRVVGVLSGLVNMDFIRDAVTDLESSTVGDKAAYLLDSQDRVLVTRDTSAPILEAHPDLNQSPRLRAALQGTADGAIAYVDHQREPVLAGVARLKTHGTNQGGGWAVASVAPERDALAAATQVRNSILAAGLFALVIAGIAAFGIARSLVRPLGALTEVIGHTTRTGDLTARAPVAGQDEIGRLGEAFNNMLARLAGVAQQTRAATENLNAATTQILASTQQQAASAAEQAAAVQETTATTEEIRQSGIQISEKARQVAASAEGTSAASQAGMHAMQTVLVGMEGIREQAETVAENIVTLSEKTQAVGDIIATVNDIAEQSNLLALNAAIEAAAAGEHGRSFAVVASEMKNLADQSRAATVQVRSILGEIQKGIHTSVMLTEEAVKRVEAGAQQSEVADRTIRQMSESILQSVQAFQQIVAATNQQQIGLEQVTQALQNIRQASDQTAQGTRQLESATASLNDLGRRLRESVEAYRV